MDLGKPRTYTEAIIKSIIGCFESAFHSILAVATFNNTRDMKLAAKLEETFIFGFSCFGIAAFGTFYQ